jgi:hypothetical protein
MKNIYFIVVCLLISSIGFSQNCPFDNTFGGNIVPTAVGVTISETCVNPGKYIVVTVTNGSTYELSTCNTTGIDVTMTIYDVNGLNILATDDDGCGPANGPSTFTGTVNFDGVILVLLDQFPCLHANSCITLDVTLISGVGCTPSTGTDVVTSCDPYTWIDGNTYTTSNNTATHTISAGAANSCDSIVTLDLTISNNNTRTDIVSSCGSFTWIDGNTYTTSNNTATHAFPAPNGCDSIISLNLTITTVSVINTDPTLVAATNGADYQWLNCLNNYSEILGQTSQSFSPPSNGSYAVEITLNNCIDTSDCYSIFSVGLEEQNILNTISVFPNPFKDIIFIEMSQLNNVDLRVFNLQNQIIYSESNITQSLFELKLDEPNGIYILEVSYDGEKKHFKLVSD